MDVLNKTEGQLKAGKFEEYLGLVSTTITAIVSPQYTLLPPSERLQKLFFCYQAFSRAIADKHRTAQTIRKYGLGAILQSAYRVLDSDEAKFDDWMEASWRCDRVTRKKYREVFLYIQRLAAKEGIKGVEFLRKYPNAKITAFYVLVSYQGISVVQEEALEAIRSGNPFEKHHAYAIIEKNTQDESCFYSARARRLLRRSVRRPNPRFGICAYQKLGKTIRDIRSDYRISQEVLARQLDLSTRAISRLEHGNRRLDAVELWAIAQAFQDYSTDLKALHTCLTRVFGCKLDALSRDPMDL